MVKIQDFFLSSTHMYQRMPRLEDVVVAIKFVEKISLQGLLLEGFRLSPVGKGGLCHSHSVTILKG